MNLQERRFGYRSAVPWWREHPAWQDPQEFEIEENLDDDDLPLYGIGWASWWNNSRRFPGERRREWARATRWGADQEAQRHSDTVWRPWWSVRPRLRNNNEVRPQMGRHGRQAMRLLYGWRPWWAGNARLWGANENQRPLTRQRKRYSSQPKSGPTVWQLTWNESQKQIQDTNDKKSLNRSLQPIDFTRIQGIGKMFAQRLKTAQIFTFAQLAAMTPEQLSDILDCPPKRVIEDELIEQARDLANDF